MARFLIIGLVVLCAVHTAAAGAPNYDDDREYENFAGRLYIDEIGVDVALYKSWEQGVVDRDDSAAYFGWPKHKLIADHNTEAFALLGSTKVGTMAYIAKEDGAFVYYECVDIFKGHNTGGKITDWDGNDVTKKEDLLMYTCFSGSKNIWVTLWRESISPKEKKEQAVLNNYSIIVNNLIDELLQATENSNESSTHEDEVIELVFVER